MTDPVEMLRVRAEGGMRASRMVTWSFLVLYVGAFGFVAALWLSYCPPLDAVKFAVSGAWFREPFYQGHAGFALDQPTVGKFFAWTSVLSTLACTLVMLLRAVADPGRRVMRRGVGVVSALLVCVVLAELLAPTFLLVQYVLSMGVTTRRLLGLGLCGALWILLPSVLLGNRKADPSAKPGVGRPLAWAWACSVVVPTYYAVEVLRPSAWLRWDAGHTAFLLVWIALVAPGAVLMARARAWYSGSEAVGGVYIPGR